jgi:hypothetical protein
VGGRAAVRQGTGCYACDVDLTLILIIVAAVWLLAVVLAMGFAAWRFLRGNEELEPGGSLGRQLFGRKPKTR